MIMARARSHAWLARGTRILRNGDGVASAVVLAVAAVTAAWPVLTVQWPPFVDYPEHVGTIAAIHGIGSETFSRYFVTAYGNSQYLLFYFLGDLLAYPFGVLLGAKLGTALGLALLPVAVGCYLRAHNRPAIFGALSAAVAIHVFVFWGFLNFAMATMLAVFAVAALAWLARTRRTLAAIAYSLLALATFYAHTQLYAWLAVASVVELIALVPAIGVRSAVRASWRAALAAVPSVLGALWWLLTSGVLESGEGALRSGDIGTSTGGVTFAAVAEVLHGFWGQSFGFYRDGSGEHIGATFLGAVLVLVAARGIRTLLAPSPPTVSGPKSEPPSLTDSLAPEAVLVASFAAWLFAPNAFRLIEPINDRFLPVALALLPVLGPTRQLTRPVRAMLAVLVLAVVLGACRVHVAHFAATDQEMGELDHALSHTRAGKRLLGLIYDNQSAIVPYAVYMHAHQYYQSRVGGLAAWGFVELPKSPIRYRDGAAPPPFPPRFEWTPERFAWETWGDAFDYFLVRTRLNSRTPRFFPPAATDAPELLFEGPRWKLYGRRE